MKNPISLIAAAYSGVALASFVALRYFVAVLEDMAKVGGGIAAITSGAGEAARFPLVAAWIAAVATAVAMIFVLAAMQKPAVSTDVVVSLRLLWPVGLCLAVGIVSVLLFRDAIDYVVAAAIPGAQPRGVNGTNMAEAVASRITFASIAIAICFVVAIVQLILQFRLPRRVMPSRVALRLTAVAFVVSLGVSMALVVGLRSYSSRHLDVALRGAPVSTVLP